MRGLDEAEVVTEERKKREKPMWYQRTVRRFTAYTQDRGSRLVLKSWGGE